MNKKDNLLDRLDVREPCAESWEEMTGNDEVRFCSHCSKNVFDLSAYTRQRAEKLVRDSNGGLCVRYRKDERGRVVTAPPPFTQIKRHAKIAAGVLATTLSVTSMAYTQGSPRPIKGTPNAEQLDKESSTLPGFVVSGTVTDVHGALIPGSKVVLIDQLGSRRLTTTNDEGDFRFVKIGSGDFRLEISSRLFKTLVVETLRVASDLHFDTAFVLEIEDGIEVVGELIVTGEPLVCDDPPKVSSDIKLQEIQNLPLNRQTFVTMGLFPGVIEKPENSKPAKKPKKKLPK